jgi:ribosomal protein S4
MTIQDLVKFSAPVFEEMKSKRRVGKIQLETVISENEAKKKELHFLNAQYEQEKKDLEEKSKYLNMQLNRLKFILINPFILKEAELNKILEMQKINDEVVNYIAKFDECTKELDACSAELIQQKYI